MPKPKTKKELLRIREETFSNEKPDTFAVCHTCRHARNWKSDEGGYGEPTTNGECFAIIIRKSIFLKSVEWDDYCDLWEERKAKGESNVQD